MKGTGAGLLGPCHSSGPRAMPGSPAAPEVWGFIVLMMVISEALRGFCQHLTVLWTPFHQALPGTAPAPPRVVVVVGDGGAQGGGGGMGKSSRGCREGV